MASADKNLTISFTEAEGNLLWSALQKVQIKGSQAPTMTLIMGKLRDAAIAVEVAAREALQTAVQAASKPKKA